MSRKQPVKQRVRIAERRRKLAELILQGVRNQKELAERLAVTDRTIRNDIVALEEEYNRIGAEVVGRLRHQERAVSLLRLERYVEKLEQDLDDPDKRIQAIRLLKELEERKAKLLGLDMPAKTAPTDPSGEREYTGIPEEAKRRIFGHARAMEAPTVEHKPTEALR